MEMGRRALAKRCGRTFFLQLVLHASAGFDRVSGLTDGYAALNGRVAHDVHRAVEQTPWPADEKAARMEKTCTCTCTCT